jgi:hypothetical protein
MRPSTDFDSHSDTSGYSKRSSSELSLRQAPDLRHLFSETNSKKGGLICGLRGIDRCSFLFGTSTDRFELAWSGARLNIAGRVQQPIFLALILAAYWTWNGGGTKVPGIGVRFLMWSNLKETAALRRPMLPRDAPIRGRSRKSDSATSVQFDPTVHCSIEHIAHGRAATASLRESNRDYSVLIFSEGHGDYLRAACTNLISPFSILKNV